MIHHIQNADCNSMMVIDDTAEECDMRSVCWKFFKTSHGKREEFEVYRGCLIIRSTVPGERGRSVRRTVVYLYIPKEKRLFCLSHPVCVSDAKSDIDRVMKTLNYSYDTFKA